MTWIWNRLKSQQNRVLRSKALPRNKKLNNRNNLLGPREKLGRQMKASESQNRPGTIKWLFWGSKSSPHFPPRLPPTKRRGKEIYRYGSGDFLVINCGVIAAGHHLVLEWGRRESWGFFFLGSQTDPCFSPSLSLLTLSVWPCNAPFTTPFCLNNEARTTFSPCGDPQKYHRRWL